MKNKKEEIIGKKYATKTKGIVTVVHYENTKNVSVKTEEGIVIENLSLGNIKSGYVGGVKPNRVGEKFKNNEGYIVEIIEYYDSSKVTVRFNDGTILRNRQYSGIKNGKITNPNYRFLYGIGYLGEGKYKVSLKSRVFKYYKLWYNIFLRCYDKKQQEKHPTYKDVTVCEEWYNFQNFAKWFEESYNPETMEGWHLDKDILVKGNKIYSPETCCFVPSEINTLFIRCNKSRGSLPIGVTFNKKLKRYVTQISKNKKREHLGIFKTAEEAFQTYKKAKEEYIKEVADKWKGLIDSKVYQAMYDYKVEIKD